MLFNKTSQPFAKIRPWTCTGSDQILSFNLHHILCNVWKSNLWPPCFFSLPTNEWFYLQENPTRSKKKSGDSNQIRSAPYFVLNSLHRILIYFLFFLLSLTTKRKYSFKIFYCAELKKMSPHFFHHCDVDFIIINFTKE